MLCISIVCVFIKKNATHQSNINEYNSLSVEQSIAVECCLLLSCVSAVGAVKADACLLQGRSRLMHVGCRSGQGWCMLAAGAVKADECWLQGRSRLMHVDRMGGQGWCTEVYHILSNNLSHAMHSAPAQCTCTGPDTRNFLRHRVSISPRHGFTGNKLICTNQFSQWVWHGSLNDNDDYYFYY